MCGIFGIHDLRGEKRIDLEKAYRATDTMHHRGPDAGKCLMIGTCTAFGHRRLSILDLSEDGNQPFTNDEIVWIVFNGEIYNYIELKRKLQEEAGVEFTTSTDTEVLLKSYLHWGKDCVKLLNGMWAFAIYDAAKKELFCSRDRFGVKPFNYAIVDDQLIFASEIKAILEYFPHLRKPNYNTIANFCRTSLGAQIEETWFDGVLRLQPGHNLWVQNGKVQKESYWYYPTEADHTILFDDAVNHYRSLFVDAVKIRMRSDVPVGSTLSSGLDSTSIVSVLRTFNFSPHNSFTAAFKEERYSTAERGPYRSSVAIDEVSIVNQTAGSLGLESHIVPVNLNNLEEKLRMTIYHLESGNSSPATIPLMQTLQVAKSEVTVILEGQGADELLLGYITPLFVPILFQYGLKLNFQKALKFLKGFRKQYTYSYAFRLYVRSLLNSSPFLRKMRSATSFTEKIYGSKLQNYTFIPDYPEREDTPHDPINRILMQQHSGGLVNLLHYGDAISMAHSLESRLPFMDYRLVEYVFKLPWSFKINNALTKSIHRFAMNGLVENSILDSTLKFGFTTPISACFRLNNGVRSEASQQLLSTRCLDRKLFSEKYLTELIEQHESGKQDHGSLLFRLLSVEIWFQVFFDDRGAVC